MSRYISYLFAVCFFIGVLAFPLSISAQGRPQTQDQNRRVSVSQEKKEQIQSRLEIVQQRIASQGGGTGTAKQRAVVRIATQAAKMVDRSQKILEHMDAIWQRVEAKIAVLEAAGNDLSSLSDEIASVPARRSETVAAISTAESSIADILDAANPKTAAKQFLEQFSLVKAALFAYHRSIVVVIRNLIPFLEIPSSLPSTIPLPSQ